MYLASQSWWDDRDGPLFGGELEHVHAEACFPYRQTVSGNVTIDVVVKLHNLQGHYLKRVRIHSASSQGSGVGAEKTPHSRCDAVDCTFIVPLTVPTNQLAAGTWEWRVGAEVRPDLPSMLKTNLATSGWQVCVRSCSGRTPQASNSPEGRGWYRDSGNDVRGYINGKFDSVSEFPWQGRFIPVSGMWQPPVRAFNGAQEDRTREPVESHFVSVDPDFHGGSPGRVVKQGTGSFTGRVLVDTTQLTNGIHRLFIRADTDRSFTGQLSGGFIVPFEVRNP